MRPTRLLAWATVACLPLCAQFGTPAAPDVVLAGEFHTAIPAAQVLANLDSYYQEQVGRKLEAVLPEIAPGERYEVWRDMWVYFAGGDGQLTVTMKRPTEASTETLAKGWMLQFAARAAQDAAVTFQELPPMRNAGGAIYGSRRELARMLEDEPEFRAVPTWQHAGLMVSVSRLARVTLGDPGPKGAHPFTAGAPTAEAAKQLAAKVGRLRTEACVCAVYSESAEVGSDLRRLAEDKSVNISSTAVPGLVMLDGDPKQIETALRADPVNQRRLAAVSGWYDVKYRIEASYTRVTIRWSELAGYARPGGTFTAARELGSSTAAAVKPAGPGRFLESRIKLAPLKPGAYRISIEGETAGGAKAAIDRRDYWFDGELFDEL